MLYGNHYTLLHTSLSLIYLSCIALSRRLEKCPFQCTAENNIQKHKNGVSNFKIILKLHGKKIIITLRYFTRCLSLLKECYSIFNNPCYRNIETNR